MVVLCDSDVKIADMERLVWRQSMFANTLTAQTVAIDDMNTA